MSHIFRAILLITVLALGTALSAQHDHQMPMPEGEIHMDMPMDDGMAMHPLGLPPSRQGSGTSWMPDSTPMYGIMDHAGKWDLMYHGAASLAYDAMGGPRGEKKLIAPNWAMAMAKRNVGTRDQWQVSAMLSLDPLTVGGEGYPLLLQTGETWENEPLRDAQHPHNYFVELSGKYTHAFNPDTAGFLYVAPVGEPALGPPAYMHRTFALDDPLAPIGHHWQDATHIAYGVVTAGFQTHEWQLEASTFNGREPGEQRYRIESPTFDSSAVRLSINPSPDLAFQLSHAFINGPEALHPDENAHRTTASAIFNRALSQNRNLQATAVWGRNRVDGFNDDSFLLEAQWKRDGGWTPFLRYERAEKSAEELVLPSSFPLDQRFTLHQATLGATRDLPSRGNYQWGIGAQVLLNVLPDELEPVYGHHPTGWLLFLRVHPKRMEHGGHTMMPAMPHH